MNYDKYLYYVWLNEIRGIGTVTSRRLLSKFVKPENIYDATLEELLKVKGIGEEVAKRIYEAKDLDRAKTVIAKCHKEDIKIGIYNEENFPQIINNYKDMPIFLYYRGKLYKDLKGVAIVGARRCSEYGKKITVEAASFLAENNIPVISGMAKGIDSYAHTACLKAKGYTAAFLGCGVDVCYPKEHNQLMQEIVASGAVISEYPPGTKPKPEYFPKRNRLISACSEKILVVEAGEKSGALLTAEYGKGQEKTLFAAPNNIYKAESKGTNKLIYEGANIYLKPEQLLLEGIITYKLKDIKSENKSENIDNNLNEMEKDIVTLIKNNPRTVDEILMLISNDKQGIVDSIFSLELEGKIKAIGGGRYVS